MHTEWSDSLNLSEFINGKYRTLLCFLWSEWLSVTSYILQHYWVVTPLSSAHGCKRRGPCLTTLVRMVSRPAPLSKWLRCFCIYIIIDSTWNYSHRSINCFWRSWLFYDRLVQVETNFSSQISIKVKLTTSRSITFINTRTFPLYAKSLLLVTTDVQKRTNYILFHKIVCYTLYDIILRLKPYWLTVRNKKFELPTLPVQTVKKTSVVTALHGEQLPHS